MTSPGARRNASRNVVKLPRDLAIFSPLTSSMPLWAIAQANIKRMLAYSTIAQMGYLLIGLIVASQNVVMAVLFHSLAYACMTIGAFGMVVLLQRGAGQGEQIDDFSGLAQRSPLAAGVMLLFLLSLTGIPPTAGFVAKVYIFSGAIHTGQSWLVALVAVAVVNTAISAFYYLRWVRTMFIDDPLDATPIATPGGTQAVLLLAGAGVLLFGLVPTPLLSAAQRAAEALL